MSGKKGKKFEKIPIGKVEKWLVDGAKEVGLDIDGYGHEITNDFINHVMKRHGNEEVEAAIGQVAVKKEDFKKIPEIVKKPDIAIVGLKSAGQDMIAYAKKIQDGTTLYLEEVLGGKKNRSLRGKTMYKRKGATDKQKFFRIVTSSRGVDFSKSKIISLAATGGDPDFVYADNARAAANSAETQGLSTSNIPQSGEKSSGE